MGCSGYVYSFDCKALAESKIYKNILIVTSETYSKFISRDNIAVAAIFGDGASATLVEPSKMKFLILTKGRWFWIFRFNVPASGLGKIPEKEKMKLGKIKERQLYMNGTARLTLINEVPKSLKNFN